MTHRNSVFQIMQQKMKIKKGIEATNHVEVCDCNITFEENEEVRGLFIRFTVLDSSTTELQNEATSLHDARNLFIGLI